MTTTNYYYSARYYHYYGIRVILSLLLLLVVQQQQQHATDAASFDEPHAHRGKVTPYPPGDPKVTLDAKALRILDSGKPYQTQITQGASGRALCVQDVHAPPSTVWNRILDFNAYSQMVPRVTHSQNYLVLPPRKKGSPRTIFTRMTIGFPMLKMEYFVKHLFFEGDSSLTWTLDYEKKSDLDDSVGYWFVRDHPEKRGWSRVYYSVELVIFDWVPQLVKNILMGKALSDATAWVKRESEKQQIAMEKKNGATSHTVIDDDESNGSTETKKSSRRRKRREAFGKFFKNVRKVLFLDKTSIGDGVATSTCSSRTVGSDDSSSCLDESGSQETTTTTTSATLQPERAGLLRIVLVSSVFLLIVFNLGLFLERVSQ